MSSFLWVFLGGGLGSICRFAIAKWMNASQLDFPLATLIANALACILLGFLFAFNLKTELPSSLKWLLMTGFCGGFSTFSTFSNETFQLLQNGETAYALTNIAGSILLCLFCIFIGLKLGQ